MIQFDTAEDAFECLTLEEQRRIRQKVSNNSFGIQMPHLLVQWHSVCFKDEKSLNVRSNNGCTPAQLIAKKVQK